jgi:hypothetical protein
VAKEICRFFPHHYHSCAHGHRLASQPQLVNTRAMIETARIEKCISKIIAQPNPSALVKVPKAGEAGPAAHS